MLMVKMKKLNNHGFTAFEGILIVIIIALIGGVGFYVYKSNQDKKSDNPTSSSQKSTQTSATKDSYKDWKTYTSSTEKMSFKYPSSWKVDNSSPADSESDSTTITTDSGKEALTWRSLVDGIGGACDFDGTAVKGEVVTIAEGGCPYYFVDGTEKTEVTSLTAVYGVRTVDGKSYTPWCALQDQKGILTSKATEGFLFFQGKNNKTTFDGVEAGPFAVGLYCGNDLQSSATKAEASKFWSTDLGKDLILSLKSASY